jgi:hypothetical protein
MRLSRPASAQGCIRDRLYQAADTRRDHQIASTAMMQISIPTDASLQNCWMSEQSEWIALSLGLIPFAGIAAQTVKGTILKF